MDIQKFKAGERVEVIEQAGDSPPIGSKGKVIKGGSYTVVEFDEEFDNGTTCDGLTKANQGYSLQEEWLEIEGEVRPITHIVLYCKDSDPHVICRGEEEVKATLKKLWNNRDVVKTSIRVFEAKELTFELDVKLFGFKKEIKIKEK